MSNEDQKSEFFSSQPILPSESETKSTKLTSTEIAQRIKDEFPQIVNGFPIYLFTGSLAVKLALQADRIELLQVITSNGIPTLEIVRVIHDNNESDLPHDPLAIDPPKDVDLVMANSGFSNISVEWDQECLRNNPAPLGKIFRNMGTEEILIETMTTSREIPAEHPFFKNWVRVWIKGQDYLIINPVVILAIRNIMPGKNEEITIPTTKTYINALKTRFPSLYERSLKT